MISTISAIAAAFTLLVGQAAPEPLVLQGIWGFRTDAVQNGRAVCTESWTFGGDGTLLIRSGAEVVRKRFRTETHRSGYWLVTETLETNGAADCTGNVSSGVTPGEKRLYLVPMNDGVILTCPAPATQPDGTPLIRQCYGAIRKVPAAG